MTMSSSSVIFSKVFKNCKYIDENGKFKLINLSGLLEDAIHCFVFLHLNYCFSVNKSSKNYLHQRNNKQASFRLKLMQFLLTINQNQRLQRNASH